MIWVFWGLLAMCVGGLFLLALLARRKRHPLRPTAGPGGIALLRAAGRSFAELFWVLSHPFGSYGARHGREYDPSKDYVRERDGELEEERQRSNQG